MDPRGLEWTQCSAADFPLGEELFRDEEEDLNDQKLSQTKAPRRTCPVPPHPVGWIPGLVWSQTYQGYTPVSSGSSSIPPSSSVAAAQLDSKGTKAKLSLQENAHAGDVKLAVSQRDGDPSPSHEKSALTSLSLFSGPITELIKCRMCHFQFPGQKCLRGRGLCLAAEHEVCATLKIFTTDGAPWLTVMGCKIKCANVNHIKWSNYLVNFRCCRGYDRCNEHL
ncbi:PREDICTED: prostate and testis expressed protein 1 [Condylura cristata]|uniref:prostate and testis expressed protein 1 n=1 Tax=Condylura cristata TaxID=143302 RepID=UPI0006433951|nr:PREDICTED: prostate and testis expressed protein 1 [Condylura cristata]